MLAEMSSFWEKVFEEADKSEAAVPVERSFAMVLGELFSGERLAAFVSGVRERMCVDGVLVFDEAVRMVFVMSGLMYGRFVLA